jgi:hypothetical protein
MINKKHTEDDQKLSEPGNRTPGVSELHLMEDESDKCYLYTSSDDCERFSKTRLYKTSALLSAAIAHIQYCTPSSTDKIDTK